MLNRKRNIVTNKQIEAIADQVVNLIFPIFGNFQGNVSGKITGRLRNRFKQFVFVPTFPFMTFNFSANDVESIKVIDKEIVVTLNEEEKKKKRKKKKIIPIIKETTSIDLTNPLVVGNL